LLIRGTGRTDFQNGDPRAQYESLFGMWKRSHGRTSEAPPDERGGYRYVRPTATASHLDSTLCSRSLTTRRMGEDAPQRTFDSQGVDRFSCPIPGLGYRSGVGVLSRCVLEFAGAVSGGMRIRGQAAKSIGCSAKFWFRVCHPSTLRIAI
jgi:hypothetical protein